MSVLCTKLSWKQNSETITTKRQAVNAFIRTCTMDNITVVDLAAEAVLQGEKAAFILLLVTSYYPVVHAFQMIA